MSNNIIVTGGAGFIGSNLVRRLNQDGIENIYVVDNIKDSLKKENNLKDLKFVDLINKDSFINNLNDFKSSSFCFHQGACSNTTEKNENYLNQNNFEYSKTLLEFCNSNKIDLIYASSAAVYGNSSEFLEVSKNENPINFYAQSKLKFDNYLRSVIERLEINVTGLRYFNVYGPREYHKDHMSSVILKFYQQMIKDKKIKIFSGSEEFLRDFIFIDDVININMLFFKNRTNGIFNVGSGVARSFMDIAKVFKNHFKDTEIEEINFPKNLEGQYQKFTQSNNNALEKKLSNLSFLTLEDGVERYINHLNEYYKNES